MRHTVKEALWRAWQPVCRGWPKPNLSPDNRHKDPERKRQWEPEHREQRNARRRALRVSEQIATTPKAGPDPASTQQPTSGWKDILGLAVGIGVIILGALAGLGTADFGVQEGRIAKYHN